ncbi:Smc5-Smc6 complex subunit NSE4 [Pneumocystis jirovecii RU7]|uniref:Non-structural maintenance of chromosomes element 4 n=1 Tax=Pneumocystis jirovecii (strain RU7) TaxID=1408657 RepID=A0A0W4ZK29_PNEJ7|nr:Smc5-Smc6 complex subunit NSE4 [Pneumocystis jirovecii RU7]KTW28726.1 hypothetical protein T551_02576 [Pneumocystis jirovecii RU7]
MVSGCYAKIKTLESLGGEILQPRKHLSPKSMNQDYYSEDIDSRLVLRQEYRKLIKTTDENKLDYIKAGNYGLVKTIKTADMLFQKVKRPQEATLDSRLLVQTVGLASMRAKRLKLGDILFDMDIYIGSLFSFMGCTRDCHTDGNSELNWIRIGQLALLCSKRPPTMSFMLGSLSVERKERRIIRQERFQKNNDDLVKPDEIKGKEMLPQDNTTPKNVIKIDNLLKCHSPIGLFEFIINPGSFCQTIENMFYLSFLMREGKANLIKANNDMLVLKSKDSSEELYQGNKKQIVMYIDMEMWRVFLSFIICS